MSVDYEDRPDPFQSIAVGLKFEHGSVADRLRSTHMQVKITSARTYSFVYLDAP